MVAGILLAAGKSARMKEPKPLLQWQGKTLLEYQIQQLSRLPVDEIIVVLGHEADAILKTVSVNDGRVKFIRCGSYRNGLSASLKCGLEHASEKYAGVLLLLVDLPLIQPRTFEQVYEIGLSHLSKTAEPFVVQPRYKKQPGHPVLLGHFRQLNWQTLEGDVGAKPLIRHIKNHILLDSSDRGVVFDIDTPEAYREAIKIEEVI
jgi:molybdenum cofactor cytidylyltransferase